MELNLLFVLLILHPALGLVLDVRVPPSLSAELGSNVSLPCTFTVDESPLKLNFLALLWKFGDRDIFTLDNKRKLSNPRVVFNEQNARKGDATLVLQNVSTADEGSYTCTVVYSPESQTRQTQLTVYALPTISNLEKLGDQLLCSVTGFYPKDISVLLLMDRTVLSSSVLASYKNIDGTYGINVSAPFTEMEKSKSFSCKVEHKYLPSPLEKHVQLVVEGANESEFNVFLLVGILVALVFIGAIIGAVFYCRHKKGIKAFIMNKIQGPDSWVDGEKITLYCTASHCTKNVQATWIIKNNDGTMCEITDSTKVQSEEEEPLMDKEYEMTNERTDKPGEKGSCDFTTSLSFIPSVSRHLDSAIICRFVCGKEKAERPFQFKSIYAKPKILEPVIFSLCEPDDVQLLVNLQRFYPQNILISWSCDGKESRGDRTSEDELKNNPDKTFSLQSKCKIPGDLFKDPAFKVCVTWQHKSMESPESREVSIRDFPWCPEIEDIPIESNSNKLNYKITKYFPDALTVTWFKKEGNTDLVQISADKTYEVPDIHSQKQADGTFTCNACLVIKGPATQKQHKQFVCRVEHPSLKKPLQTGITALQDNETFKIGNIHGPKKWIDGEKVTLYCTASYCPEDVQVTWVITECDGTVREVSELPPVKDNKGGKVVPTGYVANRERTETSDKEGLTDFTTSLSFTPSIAKHKDLSLVCKFVCGGTSKEKQFQLESLFAKPKVLDPIKLSLSSTGEVLCSFIVKEFYPKNIQINWSYGGKNHQENKTSSNEIFTEHDLTWNVQTKCKVPGHLFKDKDFTVIVKWKHKSMDGCKTKQISVRDFPWEPEIREIPIPSIFNNKPATLMCTVSNVFPDSLTVKWLRKEINSNKSDPLSDCDKYKILDIQREKHKDGTFIYKSWLTFIPSVKTDQGAELICKVDHPKLKKKQTKSTGPLQITALPDVKNICNPEDGIFTLEVDGFYPENITISWKLTVDSSKEEDITQNNSSVKSDMYENGSYRAISTCDLRKNDLIEGKSYSVTATVYHETLDSAIHRSFNMERAMTLPSPVDQKQDQECTTPTMQDNVNLSIQPTDHQRSIINAIQGPQVWTNGEKVCLYLTASYCTKDVTVTWIITERDGSVWEIPDTVTEQTSNTNTLMSSGYEATRESTDTSDKEGFLDIVSCLTVVPSVSKHSTMALSCKVICEGEVKEKQYTLKSIHAKPKVLDPIKLSLCDSGEVMYSLNLQGFYPKDIDICWECGTNQSLKSHKSQEQGNHDMTFNVQSQFKVSGKSLFKNPNFKVRVTWKHSSMDEMEFREMFATDADFPWRPEIQEIPISHVINGREVRVQYNIYKYFPNALTARWFRKERGGQVLFPLSHSENLRISDLTHKKQSDNTYTCTACLLFTPSLSSDQGAELICRVEHPSLEQPIERGTGALIVMSKPTITGPLTLSICDHSNLQCSLNLTNVYPKDIQITWLCRRGQNLQEGSPEPVFDECADHTFNVTSTCTIPVNLFIDPASNICVKWKHESMDDPESKELSIKDPGFPWRPEMEDIVIPTLLPNKQVRLQCKISHYFPNVLTVTWFKRKKGQQERPLFSNEKYNIPDIQSVIQADQSYTCTAHVTYTPSVHTEQEAEFICKVDHPSLVRPITKCTGMLQLAETPFIQPEIQLANYGNNIHSFNGQQHPFPQNIDTPFSQSENQFTSPGHNVYLVNNEEHVYLQDTEMEDLHEATDNQTRSTDVEMDL